MFDHPKWVPFNDHCKNGGGGPWNHNFQLEHVSSFGLVVGWPFGRWMCQSLLMNKSSHERTTCHGKYCKRWVSYNSFYIKCEEKIILMIITTIIGILITVSSISTGEVGLYPSTRKKLKAKETINREISILTMLETLDASCCHLGGNFYWYFSPTNPSNTPWKFNIAPENGWLENEFPFGIPYFQRLC